ncbi:fibronectin type III domain-containing protein [Halosimplex pelagicum]|uniref:Fibronectin type III domain-containing protein n=1 Tax=Halosimplex pelagicum TaxID=869886 RepID=A0A7D5T5P1_9EURY|nr:fibronectin type III domain-containing protein [Halosimplex pelagicum]QLH82452.1 fibronectin type III domain-containing protein [Halosimplex pelagicum]QLH82508.1 fibronectin type III domain-containing protein [Halosimplex pelagicum]
MSVQFTTQLPDASNLQFDASVEDQLTAEWDDTINYGQYRLQVRETGEGQSWGAVDATTVGQNTLSYVIANLFDGEQYDVRLRTETEHVEGEWLALSPITLLPAPTGLAATTQPRLSESTTIPLSWTDPSDNPDEQWRAYYSTDGGSTWTEASSSPYPTDTTSADIAGLAYSTEYTFKVRLETPHVYADSGTDTAWTAWAQDDGLWLGWERLDGTRRDTQRVIEAATTHEHTAMHGGNPVVPAREVSTDDVFAEIVVGAGDTLLLRGEIEAVKPDTPATGEATIKLRGPGLQLTRSGPGQPVTYSNIAYHDAIDDYCANESGTTIDATVHAPPTTVKSDDTEVTNPTFDGADLYSPAADEPVAAAFGQLKALPTSFTAVNWDDFDGLYTQVTTGDTDGTLDYYIDFEGARVTPNDNVTATVTPPYDIPADRVGIKVRGAVTGSGSTDLSVTFNGDDLGIVLPAPDWGSADYGGDDLEAGQTYEFELASGGDTDYDILVDAINIYDTAYPPTIWDQPTDISGEVAGPENVPRDQQLVLDGFPRPWAVVGGRIASAWSDTSNGQALALSPNAGADWVTASNQATLSADFDAEGYVGDVLQARVTLSASGSSSWLTQRAEGQEITDLDLFVTTTDLPVVGAEGVTLEDSDFENLRSLHDESGLVFVTDPVADGVEIESFVRGDPAVARSLDVRLLDVPEPSRDVRDYGNEVSVKWTDEDGRDRTFTTRDTDEVDRVGAVIPRPPVFADVSTAAGARRKARSAVLSAVANDEVGGDIQAVADVVLPGYPYQVDKWDGGPFTLTRTGFTEGVDTAEMSLQFTEDDDLVARVVETRRQQRASERDGE